MKNLIYLFVMTAFLFGSFDASAQKQKKNKKSKTKVETTTDVNKGAATSVKDSSKTSVSKINNATVTTVSKENNNEVIQQEEVVNTEVLEEAATPFIQTTQNGSINWSEQYVEAKGRSVIDATKFPNPAQAKLMATRGAVVEAQRNLLEIVQGVNVTSETKVKDMITTSDYIYSRIDGVIKGATQVGEAVEKDGYIEVTMRVPLYEKNSSIASAVYDGLPQINNKSGKVSSGDASASGTGKGGDATSNAGSIPNGLVFNYNGKTIDPALFPVVFDEQGNLLLDFSKIYDPKKGKFPKILQGTKEIFEAANFKKGTEILNVVDASNGKIVIDKPSSSKINWDKIQKVASTAGKIFKFILTII